MLYRDKNREKCQIPLKQSLKDALQRQKQRKMPNSSETVSESRSTETKTEESLVVFHVDSKNPQAPAKAKPEVKRRRILFESTCEDP